MARGSESAPNYPQWIDDDLLLPNAIASADWSMTHPALCFELGDQNGEQFVPANVINAAFERKRLCVVIWQPTEITMIDIKHRGRRPAANWCAIQRYSNGPDGAVFLALQENLDVNATSAALRTVLFTPLGRMPPEQDIIPAGQQLERILIEFPDCRENRELPRDTSISALAGIATQEYFDTIYGATEV